MSAADRERWDARWQDAERGAPSPLVTALGEYLPRSGRAVDLAGGLGRHAAWFLEQGLEATVADVSPVALAAAPEGVRPLRWDADDGPPEGPWDVVLCHRFLDRRVLGAVHRVLAPGGVLLVVHPTVVNLERHPNPSRRWLLEPGELPALVDGLVIRHHSEQWRETGCFEAVLVAVG